MSSTIPILFYDIASGPPVKSFSPNPWKTRFALNFKNLEYKTQWVELPDVTKTRRDILKMPPVRAHLDGSDYHTLPVIHDLSTDAKIGDSFDIAIYLDKQVPSRERTLIPPGSEAIMRAWNEKCNAVFSGTTNTFGSIGLLYAHGLPFNPKTAHISQQKFVDTVPGFEKWENFNLEGEARNQSLEGFKIDMAELATYFRKRDEGPFLEGMLVTYADFIVGGWLKFLSICLPEWNVVKNWDDGLWESFLSALVDRFGDER